MAMDIRSWHIGPSKPGDPNYPNGHTFYIDSNVVTTRGQGGTQTIVNDPDFLGDSGIPVEPGHYSFHPAPAVAFMVNVALRAAR